MSIPNLENYKNRPPKTKTDRQLIRELLEQNKEFQKTIMNSFILLSSAIEILNKKLDKIG